MGYPIVSDVEREVRDARNRAHEKHGANSIEAVPASEWGRWLAILGEEFGEIAGTLTYDKDSQGLRGELIDLLAVASAWVDAIDRSGDSGWKPEVPRG